jgi:hypothetical protein
MQEALNRRCEVLGDIFAAESVECASICSSIQADPLQTLIAIDSNVIDGSVGIGLIAITDLMIQEVTSTIVSLLSWGSLSWYRIRQEENILVRF